MWLGGILITKTKPLLVVFVGIIHSKHRINVSFHRLSLFLQWSQTDRVQPAVEEGESCSAQLWLAQLLLTLMSLCVTGK